MGICFDISVDKENDYINQLINHGQVPLGLHQRIDGAPELGLYVEVISKHGKIEAMIRDILQRRTVHQLIQHHFKGRSGLSASNLSFSASCLERALSSSSVSLKPPSNPFS